VNRRLAATIGLALLCGHACLVEIPDKPSVGPDACDPSCYEGPPETEGVGICSAGVALCDGGPEARVCEKQVLPELERCDLDGIADEDCNGRENDHCAVDVVTLGEFGDQGIENTVLVGDDVVMVLRNSSGRVFVDGQQFDTNNATEWLVVRLDPFEQTRWVQDLEPADKGQPLKLSGLDRGPTQGLYAVGSFTESVRYAGDIALSGFGAEGSLYVAKLDEADGRAIAFAGFAGDAAQFGFDVVALDDGVVVVGQAAGTIDFAAEGIRTSSDGQDLVIAKLDDALVPQWALMAGGAGDDVAFKVAGSGDQVVAAGSFAESLDFGGDCAPQASLGSLDAFVASFDAATGSCTWVQTFGGPDAQSATALQVDTEIHVALTFEGTVSDDTGWEATSEDGDDVAIAVLDLASGKVARRATFGGQGDQYVWDLAVAGDGRVVVVGSFSGDMNLGGGLMDWTGPMVDKPPDDGFVLMLDADLTHVFSRQFSADNDDDVQTASFLSDGELLLTGEFDGVVDFGTGIVSSNDVDAFLLRLPL